MREFLCSSSSAAHHCAEVVSWRPQSKCQQKTREENWLWWNKKEVFSEKKKKKKKSILGWGYDPSVSGCICRPSVTESNQQQPDSVRMSLYLGNKPRKMDGRDQHSRCWLLKAPPTLKQWVDMNKWINEFWLHASWDYFYTNFLQVNN